MKDFSETVRASIRRDFANANYKRNRAPKEPRKKPLRVVWLNPDSQYFRLRKFILGKAVKILGTPTPCGVWVEFLHDTDRDALNRAGGWENKRMYLLDGAKFDD